MPVTAAIRVGLDHPLPGSGDRITLDSEEVFQDFSRPITDLSNVNTELLKRDISDLPERTSGNTFSRSI